MCSQLDEDALKAIRLSELHGATHANHSSATDWKLMMWFWKLLIWIEGRRGVVPFVSWSPKSSSKNKITKSQNKTKKTKTKKEFNKPKRILEATEGRPAGRGYILTIPGWDKGWHGQVTRSIWPSTSRYEVAMTLILENFDHFLLQKVEVFKAVDMDIERWVSKTTAGVRTKQPIQNKITTPSSK